MRKEVNVVNLSFVDLLTVTIGGLALLLIIFVSHLVKLSNERVKPVEIFTDSIPNVSIDDELNIALSAIGGLEPYQWYLFDGDSSNCPVGSEYKVPHWMELQKDKGILLGKVQEEEGSILPKNYCLAVKVLALGNNEALEKKVIELKSEGKNDDVDKLKKDIVYLDFNVNPVNYYQPNIAIHNSLPDGLEDELYIYKFYKLYDESISWDVEKVEFYNRSKKIFEESDIDVKINSDGNLSFHPKSSGDYRIYVKLEGRYLLKDSDPTRVFDVKVRKRKFVYSKPKISTLVIPSAYRFHDFRFQFSVENGIPPYSWEIADLPKGLSFSKKTGLVEGVPEVELSDAKDMENYSVKVKVLDSVGNSDVQLFDLPVEHRVAKVSPLEVTTVQSDIDRFNFYADEKFDFYIHSRGGGDKHDWKVVVDGIEGVSTKRNRISGIVKESGEAIVKYEVTDSIETVFGELKLNVKNKPKLESDEVQEGDFLSSGQKSDRWLPGVKEGTCVSKHTKCILNVGYTRTPIEFYPKNVSSLELLEGELPQGIEIVEEDGKWYLKGKFQETGLYKFSFKYLDENGEEKTTSTYHQEVRGIWGLLLKIFQ